MEDQTTRKIRKRNKHTEKDRKVCNTHNNSITYKTTIHIKTKRRGKNTYLDFIVFRYCTRTVMVSFRPKYKKMFIPLNDKLSE